MSDPGTSEFLMSFPLPMVVSIRRFGGHQLLRLGASDIAVGDQQQPGWEPYAHADPPMVKSAGSFPFVSASGISPEGVA